MISKATFLIVGTSILVSGGFNAKAGKNTNPVQAELQRLEALVPGFTVYRLGNKGNENVPLAVSYTVDELRGIELNDPPLAIGQPAVYTDDRMTTNLPVGSEPYRAMGISPFRFVYFDNEWTYAGWHTWEMMDYASYSGFNIVKPYNNKPLSTTPIADTGYLGASGFNLNDTSTVSGWMTQHGYEEHRWDTLPTRPELESIITSENYFPGTQGFTYKMIDMEKPGRPMSLSDLRAESWYPGPVPDIAFETAYYSGFVNIETAVMAAAKNQGWQSVGVYGWGPFARQWHGLEDATVDPATDWSWQTYGKYIYRDDAVDVIYPSLYSFYWDNANLAYTLANADLNMQLVNSESIRKPVRPYLWDQLHGGGPGWRWWRSLPLRMEDMRAIAASIFFTGIDGVVLWNWSGTNNPHIVSIEADKDYSVGSGFSLAPEDTATWGAAATDFVRYDAIHVLDVDAANVARFQYIVKGANPEYGVDVTWVPGEPSNYPVYAMPANVLASYIRPGTESVAALIEGLALVKPIEYSLRHGEVKIDVPAQIQFRDVLPVVRRVKADRYNIVFTYDPNWETTSSPQTITLNDFDGQPGLNVSFPVDGEPRIFVVK